MIVVFYSSISGQGNYLTKRRIYCREQESEDAFEEPLDLLTIKKNRFVAEILVCAYLYSFRAARENFKNDDGFWISQY